MVPCRPSGPDRGPPPAPGAPPAPGLDPAAPVASPFDDRILGSWPVGPLPPGAQPPLGDREGFRAQAELLALRALQRALYRTPRPLAELAIGGLARLARLLDRRHLHAARAFVETALPGVSPAERDRLVLAAWRHLLRLVRESEGFEDHLLGRPFGEHFELEACDEALAVARSGTGCFLVTPHVGMWEVLGLAMGALGFHPIYLVGKPPKNAPLSRHFQRVRERQGGRSLHRDGAMTSIPQVLRAGGSVVLLLDQRARANTVSAPFFGRPARCHRSTGVLLRRQRVPMVFFACYATERPYRYRLVLPEVLRPEDVAGLSPADIAARVNAALEPLILACPEQYFWLHDRYRGA